MTFRHPITHALLGFGLAALAAGCASDDFAGASTVKGTGGFDPQIELNPEVLAAKRPSKAMSRAEYSDITADDLSLRLTAADGSFTRTWDHLADFDADERFAVGDYTLEAFYGDESSEGFEAPYFMGSQSITVEENKVTPVAISASLANALVSLDYTDNFTSYMTSYDAEVHSAGGATTAVAAAESRPVYVKAGLVEVYVNFVKPNGKGAKLLSASFTAKPRCHYRVTFDLAEGQTSGEATLKVIYDEMLDEQDVEIDLSDELLNSPAPVVTARGFTSGEAISFVPGNAPTDPLGLDIIARGGLSRVTMTTRSASLLAQGWPAEVNLVGAPAATQGTLSSLGLQARGLYNNPEQMAVVTLTDVLGHIGLVDGDDGVSEISFVVVDAMGKASDAVTLRIEAAPLEVSLANPAPLALGQSELALDLNYNGGTPDAGVQIQYFNDRATWSTAAYTATGSAEGVYRVTLTGLPISGDLRLRAKAGNLISEEITVTRVPVTIALAASDADAFARHATATATLPADAPEGVTLDMVLASGKLAVSTDGGATYSEAPTAVSGARLTASGLEPSTTYTARFEINGTVCSDPVTFTTEAAPQLPNGNMDDWTQTAHKSNMVEYFLGGDAWGTLNGLTISQWNNGGIFAANAAYRATSGTIPTTDTPSGSGSAALIRSIAWGHGTTSAGGATILKHVDRGELYLGKWEGGGNNSVMPTYGMAFASRPASMSFYYKFVEVNGHKGSAEISVYDASGAKIADNTFEVAAQDSYVLKTLPLEYAAGAAKAARIEVIFRSTAPGVSLGKNDLNWGSGWSQTHTGSMLYIDDIVLNY